MRIVWIGWLPNLTCSQDVRCLFCNIMCFSGVILPRNANISLRYFGPKHSFCSMCWKFLESRKHVSIELISYGTKAGLICPQRIEYACSVQSPNASQTQQTMAKYIECSEKDTQHNPVSPGTHHRIVKTRWQRSHGHNSNQGKWYWRMSKRIPHPHIKAALEMFLLFLAFTFQIQLDCWPQKLLYKIWLPEIHSMCYSFAGPRIVKS